MNNPWAVLGVALGAILLAIALGGVISTIATERVKNAVGRALDDVD